MEIHAFISTFLQKERKRRVWGFVCVQLMSALFLFLLLSTLQNSLAFQVVAGIFAFFIEIFVIVRFILEYHEVRNLILSIPQHPFLFVQTSKSERPSVSLTEHASWWQSLKHWVSYGGKGYRELAQPSEALCLLSKVGLITQPDWTFLPFNDLLYVEKNQSCIEFRYKFKWFTVAFDTPRTLYAAVTFLQPFVEVRQTVVSRVVSEEKQNSV